MWHVVVGTVPPAHLTGLCPELLQLLQEGAGRTCVDDILPGSTFVQSGIVHMGQQPVRGYLHPPVSCRCQSFLPAGLQVKKSIMRLLFSYFHINQAAKNSDNLRPVPGKAHLEQRLQRCQVLFRDADPRRRLTLARRKRGHVGAPQ